MTGEYVPDDLDDWLLADTITAAEYEVLSGGSEHPALIRLTDREGTVRLPAFQFDAAGRPHPIVLEINKLLGADSDPWGTADWWLGTHPLLGKAPAKALGTVTDDTLLTAARAESLER
ncbi:hypothetical protein [Streptomyces microflavus]|uniref:hypothetical protein n=1 Tax=Streptomyces microflavus TaxID=1919 RepID=UPI003659F131